MRRKRKKILARFLPMADRAAHDAGLCPTRTTNVAPLLPRGGTQLRYRVRKKVTGCCTIGVSFTSLQNGSFTEE